MKDSTHSIIRSAQRFFGGTMLSRISGMLRDVSMAYAFGTSEAIAAFMVAFRLSHLLRRLLGEGALQTAFIPHFETLRNDSPDRAQQFFKDLVYTLSSGLILIIFATMCILSLCLWGLDLSAGNYEIISLTNLMMPSLLFICLFGLNASLLQCEKSYFTPGVAPVAFNVVWIIGVCSLWSLPPSTAVQWLAGWVTLACFSQWLITIPRVRQVSSLCKMQKSRLWSKDVKHLGKPLLLGIIGVAAAQINNALDAIFARFADAEGPAFLWYALRIQQLPLALFGIAIASALLPPLTRALKSNQLETYHHFLTFALRRCTALMLPISMALLVLGSSCINLIYGHGDFSSNSVVGTTWCLWGYGIGLLPMTLVLILAPAFYARSDYKTPTMASSLAMGLNIGLNTIMITVLGLGAAGIAFATSLSALFNCVFLGWGLRSDLQSIGSKSLFVSVSKISLATGTACLAVTGLDNLFFQGYDLLVWFGGPVEFPRHFTAQLWQCGIEGLAFLATLFASGWFLGANDLLELFNVNKLKPLSVAEIKNNA
jgi:putative peptidoglycan lipid II flippase